MKKLLTLTTLIFTYVFAFGQAKIADTFKLSINGDINVSVQYSKDWIKTINRFTESKSEFQVEYHFDGKQLFYIRLAKPDLEIDETYEVKRIKINGYGYLNKKTDYKLDFFFPREIQNNGKESIKTFTNNPNFTDNEQLTLYFEELYRHITKYFAENVGTVAFFGNVIADKKNEFLYYKFDNEDFLPTQNVKIERNYVDNYSKKYEGSYRIEFDRKKIRDHKTIYFSTSLDNSKDTALLNQNSINLDELRKQMVNSVTETETTINNDIFQDQYFDNLVIAKKGTPEADRKYIGKYQTKSREDKDIEFELREGNIYYSKNGDIEKTGLWKIGNVNFLKNEGINIYSVYTINRKIGTKSKPADIGSSFDILISKDKLLYPISLPEVWNEIKKIE